MATTLGQTTGMQPTTSRICARPSELWAIGRIGLFAGTLDITEALVFEALHGITPAMVFRYIASGLIGARAATDGLAPVGLGVVLHYTIALTWTALFYAASRKLPILSRRPVVCGLLYGGFVYLVMNGIVLPLAGMPPAWASPSLISLVNGVLAVVLCVGLTISLLVRRSSAAG